MGMGLGGLGRLGKLGIPAPSEGVGVLVVHNVTLNGKNLTLNSKNLTLRD